MRVPAKRWGDPMDLAGAIIFLASPASDYVTGSKCCYCLPSFFRVTKADRALLAGVVVDGKFIARDLEERCINCPNLALTLSQVDGWECNSHSQDTHITALSVEVPSQTFCLFILRCLRNMRRRFSFFCGPVSYIHDLDINPTSKKLGTCFTVQGNLAFRPGRPTVNHLISIPPFAVWISVLDRFKTYLLPQYIVRCCYMLFFVSDCAANVHAPLYVYGSVPGKGHSVANLQRRSLAART